jgi:hypothetical protein
MSSLGWDLASPVAGSVQLLTARGRVALIGLVARSPVIIEAATLFVVRSGLRSIEVTSN